jgi:hypothetical protein
VHTGTPKSGLLSIQERTGPGIAPPAFIMIDAQTLLVRFRELVWVRWSSPVIIIMAPWCSSWTTDELANAQPRAYIVKHATRLHPLCCDYGPTMASPVRSKLLCAPACAQHLTNAINSLVDARCATVGVRIPCISRDDVPGAVRSNLTNILPVTAHTQRSQQFPRKQIARKFGGCLMIWQW